MKKFAVTACIALLAFSSPAFAKSGRGGGGRIHYSGSYHNSSHGGHYAGGNGSSHKGGHYKNSRTGNRYGTHK